MLKEFKEFISRGSVLDMAVGVIIGSALTAVVKSLTDTLLNPFIGLFLGSVDLSAIKFTVGSANFRVGTFLNSVISFLIISFVVFLLVKFVNRFRRKEEVVEETPEPTDSEKYLKEIVELLQKNTDK